MFNRKLNEALYYSSHYPEELYLLQLQTQREWDTQAEQTLHTAMVASAFMKDYFDSVYLFGHVLIVT